MVLRGSLEAWMAEPLEVLVRIRIQKIAWRVGEEGLGLEGCLRNGGWSA